MRPPMRAISAAFSRSSGDSPRRAASRDESQSPSAIDDAMSTPYHRIETERPPTSGRSGGTWNARAMGPGDRNTAPYYPTALGVSNEKASCVLEPLTKNREIV